jgi:hypothetical protein
MGDVLGYARVSTADQDLAGQSIRLTQTGAIKVFTDVRSARSMDRLGLDSLLACACKGDTLAVVRLDRFGRSFGELLATVGSHLCAPNYCRRYRPAARHAGANRHQPCRVPLRHSRTIESLTGSKRTA